MLQDDKDGGGTGNAAQKAPASTAPVLPKQSGLLQLLLGDPKASTDVGDGGGSGARSATGAAQMPHPQATSTTAAPQAVAPQPAATTSQANQAATASAQVPTTAPKEPATTTKTTTTQSAAQVPQPPLTTTTTTTTITTILPLTTVKNISLFFYSTFFKCELSYAIRLASIFTIVVFILSSIMFYLIF
jgi:hypothetical protein